MTNSSNIVEVIQCPANVIDIDQRTIAVAEIASIGPQGPLGPQGPPGSPSQAELPKGGDTGNILIKQSSANYDANWAATLDGGTFN